MCMSRRRCFVYMYCMCLWKMILLVYLYGQKMILTACVCLEDDIVYKCVKDDTACMCYLVCSIHFNSIVFRQFLTQILSFVLRQCNFFSKKYQRSSAKLKLKGETPQMLFRDLLEIVTEPILVPARLAILNKGKLISKLISKVHCPSLLLLFFLVAYGLTRNMFKDRANLI